MMRSAIKKALNKLSAESQSMDFDVMAAYQIIFEYQKETRKPVFKMDLKMVNGVLFIDGVPKNRIVPLVRPFCTYTPIGEYCENKILTMAEDI